MFPERERALNTELAASELWGVGHHWGRALPSLQGSTLVVAPPVLAGGDRREGQEAQTGPQRSPLRRRWTRIVN